jgi:hypothetical protein
MGERAALDAVRSEIRSELVVDSRQDRNCASVLGRARVVCLSATGQFTECQFRLISPVDSGQTSPCTIPGLEEILLISIATGS